MKKSTFEKYADLIRKRAHEYSAKFGIDYEEMEAQGFLIYCECLEKYDISKARFTTYLYIQLNRLGDFARTYIRQKGYLMQDYYSNGTDDEVDYEQQVIARQESASVIELLEDAKQHLSVDAYNLLYWIVRREWECKNRRKPTVAMAMRYFGCAKEKMTELWEECKAYWNDGGFAVYA